MNLQESNNLIYHLCFDRNFDVTASHLADFADDETIQHWLSLPERRKMVYRRLVLGSVFDVVEFVFEKTFSHLTDDETENRILDFLQERKPQSPHFWNIPKDFYEYMVESEGFVCQGRPFLSDLARFEYHRWRMYQGLNQNLSFESQENLALDQAQVQLNSDLGLHVFDYAVHAVEDGGDVPVRQDTRILLYRDTESRVAEVFALNEKSFLMMDLLIKHTDLPLGQILEKVVQSFAEEDPQQLLQEALGFIKMLMEKKVILALV